MFQAFIKPLIAAAALGLAVSPTVAQTPRATATDAQEAGFRAFLQSIRPRALAAGVSAATFDSVTPTLSFNPRVIALDRAQPGPIAPAMSTRTGSGAGARATGSSARSSAGSRRGPACPNPS